MTWTKVGVTTNTLLRALTLGGLLFTIAASLSTEAYAAPSVRFGSSCNDPTAKHVSMYYVNGVATSLSSAVENYTALGLFILNSTDLRTTLTNNKICLHLGYKYNPTAGAILELYRIGATAGQIANPVSVTAMVRVGYSGGVHPCIRPTYALSRLQSR